MKPLDHGVLTGWCNRCGREEFNGLRHRCPKKLALGVRQVMHAASVYVRARRKARAGTAPDTLVHTQAEREEAAAFELLADAVTRAQEGATNGEDR